MQQVRESTQRVVNESTEVRIDDQGILQLTKSLIGVKDDGEEDTTVAQKDLQAAYDQISWDDEGWHYHHPDDDGADGEKSSSSTCQYIMVLDSLNFCFWPTSGKVPMMVVMPPRSTIPPSSSSSCNILRPGV